MDMQSEHQPALVHLLKAGNGAGITNPSVNTRQPFQYFSIGFRA